MSYQPYHGPIPTEKDYSEEFLAWRQEFLAVYGSQDPWTEPETLLEIYESGAAAERAAIDASHRREVRRANRR